MLEDELIPNPSPELIALARKFKLHGRHTLLDEASINYRCGSRKCKRPGVCVVRRCQRMKACQLAALSGWPWPLPGCDPDSPRYDDWLGDCFERLAIARRERAESEQEETG